MPVSRILDASNLVRGGSSHVELSDITAALVSKKQLSAGTQASLDTAEELRVASNRLTSLVAAPSSFLHAVVPHITILDASHNQLRDFSGLEMFTSLETLNLSHNQVQVLDAASASALLPLRRLQTVILSHNQLKYMDWDVNGGAGAARGSALRRSRASMSGEFSSPGAGHHVDEDDWLARTFTIASLDLSHNDLIELPDLRALPLLEELYLEENGVEDLTDLDVKVPLLHLQALTLAHNGLATCAALVPLAALGETLLHLTLDGNPFTLASAHTVASTNTHGKTTTTTTTTSTRDNERRAHALDAAKTTAADAAAPGWWRPFALFLAPLLITLDEVDLSSTERHLAGAVLFRPRPGAPLSRPLLELMNPPRGSELEAYLQQRMANTMPAARPVPVNGSVSSLNTQRTATTATTITTGSDGSPNGSLSDGPRSGTAPLPVVVKAMQGKLKSLSGVVQILWHAHLHQPAAAASSAVPRAPHSARGDPDAATVPPDSARSTASSTANADMQEVVTAMRNLQQVMTSMWGDLDEFRAVVAREQFKAALTIQRYYRGFRARCEWRVLRADYHAFVDGLTPDVCLLQRAGRGLLSRRRLGPRYEAVALRKDVTSLRGEVEALRRLVEQHCQSTAPASSTVPAASTAPAAAAPARGRHTDPALVTNRAPAVDEAPAASAPLKPTRIMVRRRSSSGGSNRGSSLPSVSTAHASPGPATATVPARSETPDRLDDLDEL